MAKLTTATFTKRVTVRDYEHEELTLNIMAEEGDSDVSVIDYLMTTTRDALAGKLEVVEPISRKSVSGTAKTKNNITKEEKSKEVEVLDGQEIPPVIEEEEEEKKPVKKSTETKKETSKKSTSTKKVDDADLRKNLVTLTKKLQSREAVNELIKQACGDIKKIEDMTDKEKGKLMGYLEGKLND